MRRAAPRALPMVCFLAVALLGCSGEPESGTCGPPKTMGAVLTAASFGHRLEGQDGVAYGIDVDGKNTAVDVDDGTCGKSDFVSPTGETGVDNQFAVLLPLIEGLVGKENIDKLLQGAIANGQLLIVMALDGVDDPVNDDCVGVRLGAGLGTPYLDSDSTYEPYQTFGFDAATPVSTFSHGRIEHGVLRAGPADAVLPVRVLDANFNLAVFGAKIELTVTPEPKFGGVSVAGVLDGGIDVEAFKKIVGGLNIGSTVINAVSPVVGAQADLAPDEGGYCQQISAALKIETTTAYIYDP